MTELAQYFVLGFAVGVIGLFASGFLRRPKRNRDRRAWSWSRTNYPAGTRSLSRERRPWIIAPRTRRAGRTGSPAALGLLQWSLHTVPVPQIGQLW